MCSGHFLHTRTSLQHHRAASTQTATDARMPLTKKVFPSQPPSCGLKARREKPEARFNLRFRMFIVLSFFAGLSCVCVCVPAKPHAFLPLKVRNAFYDPSISTRSLLFAKFLCHLARDSCSERLPFNIVFSAKDFCPFAREMWSKG